jgi:hypothetical protein
MHNPNCCANLMSDELSLSHDGGKLIAQSVTVAFCESSCFVAVRISMLQHKVHYTQRAGLLRLWFNLYSYEWTRTCQNDYFRFKVDDFATLSYKVSAMTLCIEIALQISLLNCACLN